MAESTWEDRYKRAVLNFIGAPKDIDLATVKITTSGSDGYHYSEYTYSDGNISVFVEWEETGTRHFNDIDGPEQVANLMQSFLAPTESSD